MLVNERKTVRTARAVSCKEATRVSFTAARVDLSTYLLPPTTRTTSALGGRGFGGVGGNDDALA